jgi:hypothetical protein
MGSVPQSEKMVLSCWSCLPLDSLPYCLKIFHLLCLSPCRLSDLTDHVAVFLEHTHSHTTLMAKINSKKDKGKEAASTEPEDTSTEQVASTSTSIPPMDDLNLWDETAPSKDLTTMVEWLAPTFNKHKGNLFRAVKGSHQSQLHLDKMVEKHDAGRFPEFIESLVAPKALDGLPGLQPLWDGVHSQYKEGLYQALLTSRQEKLSTQYSSAISTMITKSLVGDFKNLIAAKSQSDPAHKSTFEAEGKAAYNLFSSSITHWEQEAREQALHFFQRQRTQRDANESQALDSANVSDMQFSNNCNTNTPSDHCTNSYPATGIQVPPLFTEGHLPTQGKGKRSRNGEGNFQRQPQRGLQGKRISNKGKGNVDTQLGSVTKPKNRRLSKAHKNRLKVRNKITEDLLNDQAELKIMKSNLRKIGVAQKLVHNLTGKAIPEAALNCLALGSKFIPVPKPKPDTLGLSMKLFRRTIRLRHTFQDDGNNTIPDYWIPSSWNPPFLDQRRDIETMLSILSQSLKPNTVPTRSNINKNDIREYNKLLYDHNTLVILADKNLGYAVVTKSWYIQRCLDHLDSQSYVKVTEDYHKGLEGKTTVNFLIDSLTNLVQEFQDHLSIDEIKWILQKPIDEWEPMKFYITAKVHKKPVKGRPIVPSMTWMTFHLSEWLANQLNPLIPLTEWVLKDSYDLLDALKQLNLTELPCATRIASADVDALYPSMDINTGLELIKQFIEDVNWGNRHKKDFLLKAMEFVLTKGYIAFQNDIYQQTNGAAMGSPMIPPYANIFMYQLEKQTVHKHKDSGTLLLYKRFIDDVLIITKDSNIAELQGELNSLNPSIKLTWTPPAKHCNFLDIIVTFKNNKLCTSVYQKQLNTYAYLPFHSYHTTSQKKGFIKGEAIRYARICTSEADFKLMIRLFTLRLQRRGYPLTFINRSLGQVQHKDRLKYTVSNNNAKKSKVIPLLFKTEYNPAVSHHNVRTALNQFTANIMKLANTHPSISQRITICYKVPPKLHRMSLKARKEKGL